MRMQVKRNGYVVNVDMERGMLIGVIELNDGAIMFNGKNYAELEKNMDVAVRKHIDSINTTGANNAEH